MIFSNFRFLGFSLLLTLVAFNLNLTANANPNSQKSIGCSQTASSKSVTTEKSQLSHGDHTIPRTENGEKQIFTYAKLLLPPKIQFSSLAEVNKQKNSGVFEGKIHNETSFAIDNWREIKSNIPITQFSSLKDLLASQTSTAESSSFPKIPQPIPDFVPGDSKGQLSRPEINPPLAETIRSLF